MWLYTMQSKIDFYIYNAILVLTTLFICFGLTIGLTGGMGDQLCVDYESIQT